MSAIDDLIGADGVVKQLLLWGVVNQVVGALAAPGFAVLTQDVNAAHPVITLDASVVAEAVARGLMTAEAGQTEVGKDGIDAARWKVLQSLATVRLAPADLATAVLRSYLTAAEAQAIATPQGYTAEQMAILADLAGDAPGADQLAEALRRGIIGADGTGPDSTSYIQGIAETRLHNKWAPVLQKLSAALLSPPDAADAVVRNFLSAADGEKIAAESGFSAADFTTMTHLAGDAPGPQQLAEALRRGAIVENGTGAAAVSFDQGIAEGRLADKWAPVIKSLSTLWPTPVDALRATLQGQVTMEQGQALYEKLGGDLQFFQVLFDSEGSSPTPLELIEMANRGLIPWDGTGPQTTSYEQGFLEGPWRDKWSQPYRQLGQYVPPISTVTGLLSHGVIDTDTASALLAKQGMSADLIAAYIEEAHIESLSQYRGLSQGVAIDAYKAHLITADQLNDILMSLHVTAEAATLLVEYADFQRAFAQINAAVTRIRSLYVARKITPEVARDALTTLDIAAVSVDEILATWAMENAIEVRTLTPLQIAQAFEYGAMTQPEAMIELSNVGYTPYDAWVVLSAQVKGALPGKPTPGPAPLQGLVVPGTT